MQYILTETEYNELKYTKRHSIDLAKGKLQKLCTKIAEEMPIKFWGNTEAKTWGCILTKGGGPGYCDECPVQDICPETGKEWSK